MFIVYITYQKYCTYHDKKLPKVIFYRLYLFIFYSRKFTIYLELT